MPVRSCFSSRFVVHQRDSARSQARSRQMKNAPRLSPHSTPVQQDWTAAECTCVDGVRLTSRLFQQASLMPLAVLSITRHVRDKCRPKCATEAKLYAIDSVQYDATYDSSSLENELNGRFLMKCDGVAAAPERHVIMINVVGIDPRSSDCECPWPQSRMQSLHLHAADREFQQKRYSP